MSVLCVYICSSIIVLFRCFLWNVFEFISNVYASLIAEKTYDKKYKKKNMENCKRYNITKANGTIHNRIDRNDANMKQQITAHSFFVLFSFWFSYETAQRKQYTLNNETTKKKNQSWHFFVFASVEMKITFLFQKS